MTEDKLTTRRRKSKKNKLKLYDAEAKRRRRVFNILDNLDGGLKADHKIFSPKLEEQVHICSCGYSEENEECPKGAQKDVILQQA